MSANMGKESSDLSQLLDDTFTSLYRTGYITAKGVSLPVYYNKYASAIENFEVRDDDIWICSFPKSGTTWAQEMIWCLANDLDYERAKQILDQRFPFLESSCLADFSSLSPRLTEVENRDFLLDSIEIINKTSSPRFIKSHLPLVLLPRALREGRTLAKIIYVSRNVKDTCISYYHHCRLLERYKGDFQQFCQLFIGDKLNFCPFWKHQLDFWTLRNNSQYKILFLKYENMKSDLASVIEKTAAFLDKPALLKAELDTLVDHLSFSSMKNNPAVNKNEVIEFIKKYRLNTVGDRFMRSGKVEQWKVFMSDDLLKKFDEWTEENVKDFPGFSTQ